MITLAAFDDLSRDGAREMLRECCGSLEWASRLEKGRPYRSLEQLLERSDETWWSLRREDWLEAFRGHPRLGDSSVKVDSTSSTWSRAEQAAIVAQTDAQDELRRLNKAYEDRFGFIFILCATGKSANEVRAALERRLKNDPVSELREAAEEQNNITRLRLRKLFEPPTVTPLRNH